MPRLRLPAALLALSLLPACTEYEYAEQDLDLAYDAEADVAEVTIETRGIWGTQTGPGESVEEIDRRAADRIRAMAAGYRYFHVITWPFVLDLDAPSEEDDWESEGGEDEELRRLYEAFRSVEKSLTVPESRVFLDAAGEVGVFQRVRIEKASVLVDAFNEGLSLSLLEMISEPEPNAVAAPEDDVFESPEAHRLLLAHARARRPWISLDGEGLSLHLPMTKRDLGRAVRNTLAMGADREESAREGAAMALAFFTDLDGIEVDGDVVTLRMPFGDDGIVRMRHRRQRNEDATRLPALFEDGELPRRAQ
ncbi:MAG: hypothetical protein AAGI22_30280 [Planctomycetota bacterium]